MSIVVKTKDIAKYTKNKYFYWELFTKTLITRKRRFYKRDEGGYYYIPELNQSKDICECGHKQWDEHKSSFYEKNKDLKMVAQECNVKGCKCKKFKLRKPDVNTIHNKIENKPSEVSSHSSPK